MWATLGHQSNVIIPNKCKLPILESVFICHLIRNFPFIFSNSANVSQSFYKQVVKQWHGCELIITSYVSFATEIQL